MLLVRNTKLSQIKPLGADNYFSNYMTKNNAS